MSIFKKVALAVPARSSCWSSSARRWGGPDKTKNSHADGSGSGRYRGSVPSPTRTITRWTRSFMSRSDHDGHGHGPSYAAEATADLIVEFVVEFVVERVGHQLFERGEQLPHVGAGVPEQQRLLAVGTHRAALASSGEGFGVADATWAWTTPVLTGVTRHHFSQAAWHRHSFFALRPDGPAQRRWSAKGSRRRRRPTRSARSTTDQEGDGPWRTRWRARPPHACHNPDAVQRSNLWTSSGPEFCPAVPQYRSNQTNAGDDHEETHHHWHPCPPPSSSSHHPGSPGAPDVRCTSA